MASSGLVQIRLAAVTPPPVRDVTTIARGPIDQVQDMLVALHGKERKHLLLRHVTEFTGRPREQDGTMGSMGDDEMPHVDVLLVGAGFASFTLLNRLRKMNLKVRIYEKGAASGGIWYWNCYPGARVDSDTPIYQLFDKELWEDFTFEERYAGWKELRRYFKHIEK
ncbi:hypothetical protein LTR53_004530, partial [Teratosphaeriaceae sp. CCFEE 6253]